MLGAQGARLEMVALSSSAKTRLLPSPLPWQAAAHRDRGRQLQAGALFTAVRGRKQADVNEGWRFHEAQLVDGRFNVTGLNWAMIRTVCKIHFLAGLRPPAPSSERSSPSPSSYPFECNKNWTRHCCAQFLLTNNRIWKERKGKKSWTFFVTSYKWFFFFFLPHVDCEVSSLRAPQWNEEEWVDVRGHVQTPWDVNRMN